MKGHSMLIGIGLGAGLAYLFDPGRGTRRRALLRDQLIHVSRRTRHGVEATCRDMANRTQGIAAVATRPFRRGEDDDITLVERVRAKLGRATSHPRAIDVFVRDGIVTLRGPILAREVESVLGAVHRVPGVQSVRNDLDPHQSALGVPSLQGGRRIVGSSLDILQRNWAPATQALVAVAGVAAAGLGLASLARR